MSVTPTNAKLMQLWREARNSYWFLPSLMLVAAMLLAVFTDWLDTHYGAEFLAEVPWLYKSQVDGARAVLSAIATSMIGVAGVTFSMTIVSVSFAASNLGPRLIGNFMGDTGNQVTLGTFIATFVYCLLVLRTVTDGNGSSDPAYVPNISLLVALLLTLASVAVLIYFIHHIPESINVSRITFSVGRDLHHSVGLMFADQIGEPAESVSANIEALQPEVFAGASPLTGESSGYLQAISTEKLMQLARDRELILRLEYRPGDFYVAGGTLAYVQTDTGVDAATLDELKACFVFGPERTAAQNTLFLVDQLVEIMARALSPGVNDPYTAVSCIDWLQAAATKFMSSAPSRRDRYDEHGNLRVVLHTIGFEGFAEAIFSKPLQYVAADRMAALHMMHMIAELSAAALREEDRLILLRHARTLQEAGDESLPLASARTELNLRYEQTKRIAMDRSYGQALRDETGWLGGEA